MRASASPNRFQEVTVAFLDTDLKLRFDIGIRLINQVAFPAPCRRHES